MQRLIGLIAVFGGLLLGGCTTTPPKNTEDICAIFREKSDWYGDALKSQEKWGSAIPVMMAMMHQESRFVADAQPPRPYYLGFIPGFRPSSAYGYAQAKDETWDTYLRSSGNYGNDRDDFADAIDFVGWYNAQSNKRNKIALTDTRNLYLAYHEGNGGYEKGTYKAKKWLPPVADKVANVGWRYSQQLKSCEAELKESGGGWFW